MGNIGNTGRISPIHGRESGTHFSDEELFTYSQSAGQHDELWYIMYQHIAGCSSCRTRVTELEQSEQVFKMAVSRASDITYAPIDNAVMQRIFESKRTGAQRLFANKNVGRPLVFPMALALVILSIITLSVFLLPRPAAQGGQRRVSLLPTVPIGVKAHVSHVPTATPTGAAPVVTSTKAVTTVFVPMTLQDCTNGLDQVKQRLRICGYNFIVGDNIVLILVNSNGKVIRWSSSIQVQRDGTFSQVIAIHSCKDVPYTIYAQDISVSKTKKSTPMSITRYKNC